MNCKDCLHEDVCEKAKHIENYRLGECKDFKDVNEYVKIVRCVECTVPHNKWTGCPNLNGLVPPPGHYCGFGTRDESNWHRQPTAFDWDRELKKGD
jgi:hypothetical protein